MPLSRIKLRSKIINYIYSYLVLNEELSIDRAVKFGNYSAQEIKLIKVIIKNFDKYKSIIQKFLKKKWPWHRIDPLEQAILIYGCFELNINDKALVINELIVIAKGYIPGDSYKFINAILDNVGDLYAKRN